MGCSPMLEKNWSNWLTFANLDDRVREKLSSVILANELGAILILLESSVKANCDKMGEHITFIEDVYSKVKYPMEYVADKITSTKFLSIQYSKQSARLLPWPETPEYLILPCCLLISSVSDPTALFSPLTSWP